jgi:hypothetical protein
MSGRHAGVTGAGRRSALLVGAATVLGLWFGLRAPEVTPVAPPAAAVQEQPGDQVTETPVVPQQVHARPGRGDGR